MNSLILAWFCGLRASWMTFAASPDIRAFLNMPAMVCPSSVGLPPVLPGTPGAEPPVTVGPASPSYHPVYGHAVVRRSSCRPPDLRFPSAAPPVEPASEIGRAHV